MIYILSLIIRNICLSYSYIIFPTQLTVFPIGTYVIFAVSSLMSALILLILPDTSGLALPETIEDIENIYEKDKISENTKLSAEMTNFSSIKNKGAKD